MLAFCPPFFFSQCLICMKISILVSSTKVVMVHFNGWQKTFDFNLDIEKETADEIEKKKKNLLFKT